MIKETRENLLQSLREQVRRLERGHGPGDSAAVGTGCAALDHLLPGGGFQRGTLVEWLAAAVGSGAQSLALLAAREACRSGGALVIVDRRREFYPPAAAAWKIDFSRMLVVRPNSPRDERWVWDQALRCPGVAVVWGEIETLDANTFRRWQLAAEQGRTLGFLLRSHRARGQPSWANLQFLVTPKAVPPQASASPHKGSGVAVGNQHLRIEGPSATTTPDPLSAFASDWRWRLEITRCRNGQEGRMIDLVWDVANGIVREATTRV